jgi:hypothetical protein
MHLLLIKSVTKETVFKILFFLILVGKYYGTPVAFIQRLGSFSFKDKYILYKTHGL